MILLCFRTVRWWKLSLVLRFSRWYWCVQSVQRNKFVEFPVWGANHWCISDEFHSGPSLLDWTIELLQTQCLNDCLAVAACSLLILIPIRRISIKSQGKLPSFVDKHHEKTQAFLPCSTRIWPVVWPSPLMKLPSYAPSNVPFGRIAWKGPTQPRPKRSSVSW